MSEGGAMVLVENPFEESEYRLVLIESDSNEIWIGQRSHILRLPRITIRRWARLARQVKKSVEAVTHENAIVLEILPGKDGHGPCAIVEMCSPQVNGRLPTGSVDEISEEELTMEERAIVEAVLSGSAGERGPFARRGWIQDAKKWLCKELDHDIASMDAVDQFNASATFTLARFGPKVGPVYWLKATGEPNTHEFGVTSALRICLPQFLPTIVAMRHDWNAWLMEDGGIPLSGVFSLPAWKNAVTTLAVLQQESISHLSFLLANGCRDQRLFVLLDHFDEMVDYLEAIMLRQISTKAPRLAHTQMETLRNVLRDACLRMIELAIPDTLVHGDINPGNILFDGNRCVFIDWAEAYIGNPLLTFERLMAHLISGRGDGVAWVPSLMETYKREWHKRLSAAAIDQAFSVAPLLSVATYLFGRGDWFQSPRRDHPAFQEFARSLARKMYKLARTPATRGVSC